MGLFSFFSKKKEELKRQVKFGTIPTVDADPKMFSTYAVVFHEVMADVDGFTPEEFNEMVKFISEGQGGYMNMHHYHKHVFNNYFAGRHWAWAEYDYWEKTYAKMGSAPLRFPTGLSAPLDRGIELTADKVLKDLKVADLKEFIESQGVVVPPKAKKKDLLELAQSLPNLKLTKLWKVKEEQVSNDIGYPLYIILMRYITFKAKATFDRDRGLKLGVTEFKHLYIEEGDEKFVKLALKRNPQALPPYFPGDATLLQSVIPGFD